MSYINGKQPQNHTLEASRSYEGILSYLLFWVLGSLAIIFHARFRLNIGIPGHHGLIFMAILAGLKYRSNHKYSGSVFSLGVLSMIFLPFVGFNNPVSALSYILPGFLLDLLSPVSKKSFFLYVTLAALSYTLIPLSKIVLHFVINIPYKSVIKFSIPFVLASYFAFGFIGSFAGTIVLFHKNKHEKN